MRMMARLRVAVRYLLVLTVVAYALIPFYWVLVTAVRPTDELLDRPVSWLPGGVSLDNFTSLWSAIPFSHYLWNSSVVAVSTTLLSVSVSALAAYALFRFRFVGAGLLLAGILFTVTISTVVVLVPFYILLTDLGLTNSRTGLVLSYTVWAIPFATLLLRSYFQTAYPVDVEEAALLDGCSRLSVLWRVMIPLSIPGLVAAAIFTVILSWNEYVWASVVASGEDTRTASVGLQTFVGQLGANQSLGQWMAAAVVMTLPLLLLFMGVQRYVTVSYGASQGRH